MPVNKKVFQAQNWFTQYSQSSIKMPQYRPDGAEIFEKDIKMCLMKSNNACGPMKYQFVNYIIVLIDYQGVH